MEEETAVDWEELQNQGHVTRKDVQASSWFIVMDPVVERVGNAIQRIRKQSTLSTG